MASSCYSPVTWVAIHKDAFYFQDPDVFKEVAAESDGEDVVDDSFSITNLCPSYWVQNKADKFLLLNQEQQFQVQNLTRDLIQPECKFIIQIYRDNERTAGLQGKFAMLYVKKEGKNMVACCGQNNDVYPKEMEALPVRIPDTNHKALFFMTKLAPSNMYEFKSTTYPTSFLGFETDGDNPNLNKLVLCSKTTTWTFLARLF